MDDGKPTRVSAKKTGLRKPPAEVIIALRQ